MTSRGAWLTLVPVALFLLVYILPLGVRPVSSPDESRYAQLSQEMILSGDWVVPRLDGLRYFEKPPLGYWLNAVSQKVFGPTAFAIRLPAALSAGGVALIVALLLRHALRDRFVTCVGALASLTMLEVFLCGGANILDGPFSLFLTASIAGGYLACQATRGGPRYAWWATAGAACGLAFLTKGFLAVVLPLAVLLPYLAWQGQLRSALRLAWLPVLVACAVVAPWTLAISLREGDFWRYFVVEQHLRRFGGENAQHAEPFWYFVPVLLVGGLPWVVLLPAAIKRHLAAGLDAPLSRLAVCWLLFPFVFFSLSSGKLSTYVLPCFPPVAILVAVASRSLFGEPMRRAFGRCSSGLGALLMGAGAVAVLCALPGAPTLAAFADDAWKLGALGAALAVWGVLVLRSGRAAAENRRMLLFAVSPALVFLVLPFSLPEGMVRRFPGGLIGSIVDRVDGDTMVVSDRSYIQPTCWTLKRSDVHLVGKGGELSYGLEHSAERRSLTVADLSAVLRDGGRTFPVVCILDDQKHLPELSYPEPEWKVERPGLLMMGFAAPQLPGAPRLPPAGEANSPSSRSR